MWPFKRKEKIIVANPEPDFSKLKSMYVGLKVIAVSNGYQTNENDDSIAIGTISDIIPLSQSRNPMPLVLYTGDPEPKITFSCLMEYSDRLWETLNKLNPEERYLLIQDVCHRVNLVRSIENLN